MTESFDHQTRLLRQQIGRQRRQIDAQARAVEDQARRLASWRTYAWQYPGWTAAAAFGVGLAAAGLRGGGPARWLGSKLAGTAARNLLRNLWRDVCLAIFSPSRASRGDDHDRD